MSEALCPDLRRSFPPRVVPTTPTLFRAAGHAPQTYRTLNHLAADLAALLSTGPDGQACKPRELVLIRAAATYPGFDTFPVFNVHGLPPPGERGPPPRTPRGQAPLRSDIRPDTPHPGRQSSGGTWLCAVAIQATPPQDLDELVTAALGRVGSGALRATIAPQQKSARAA